MSTVEQLVTIIGAPMIFLPSILVVNLFGPGIIAKILAAIIFVIMVSSFFIVKAWVWKHTIYPNGWMSATFVWDPESYPEEMR